MAGAGIFSLPHPFGSATGSFGALIAWCIAAGSMYVLTSAFQALALVDGRTDHRGFDASLRSFDALLANRYQYRETEKHDE